VVEHSSVASLDQLEVGATALNSLYDDQGILLISAGVEITRELIERLRQRGITSLYCKRSPGKTQVADRASTRSREASITELSRNYSAKKVLRIQDQFAASEKAIHYLCQTIDRAGVTDLRRTEAHVDDYVRELVDDPDPVVASALRYQMDLDLARRCVQFSVLSLAIARQFELPAVDLRDLGSAALVHDWSLFDLPVNSRFPHQLQSEEQRAKYLQHPLATVEMLQRVKDVRDSVKQYVAQVHEALDGSGFPLRLTVNELHPISKILSLADAYLTLTSPPKGCPRVVPCDAIAYLINATIEGKYSAKAMTGLLQAVTLYPLGSIVELSDTTRARVIRANGKDYGYPIVESLADSSRIINLKECDLFVTRPIPMAEFNEVRLNDALPSVL
jgi:HD-GYP domain-containing protein (c-di-GMP phosphodiesterase class II)